jgi:hypothetical protein
LVAGVGAEEGDIDVLAVEPVIALVRKQQVLDEGAARVTRRGEGGSLTREVGQT